MFDVGYLSHSNFSLLSTIYRTFLLILLLEFTSLIETFLSVTCTFEIELLVQILDWLNTCFIWLGHLTSYFWLLHEFNEGINFIVLQLVRWVNIWAIWLCKNSEFSLIFSITNSLLGCLSEILLKLEIQKAAWNLEIF